MKMLSLWWVWLLIGVILLLDNSIMVLGESKAFGGMCPEPVCECDLDEMGRMVVSCMHGHMYEIPMSKMNPTTEIIRIIAPNDRPNRLNIGRFFSKFKKLEELHIVGSNIPNIGENSFWGVQSLRILNLTRNNLSLILDTNFKGLVNVEMLSLSDNAIESLVSASFQHLPKLKALDLSSNRIGKLVERLFYNLHMLEVLNISGNRIVELNPDVFRDIWRLKELKCRKCGLKTINPLLYALLPDLRILDLGSNEFKYLNRDEFHGLSRLEMLLLDGNQISAVTDDTFRSLRLHILSLSSNIILRIDRHAFTNTSIYKLDISGNKFESLDRATFYGLKKNLYELDLSRNPKMKLDSLSIILAENPQLIWLSLAQNQLEQLPLELFELQSDLRLLNLSGNYLSTLYPHQLSHQYKLEVLDLSYNQFKGIDPDVLHQLQRIKGFREIRLEGNPWVCDLCNIQGLLGWVQTTEYFKHGCMHSEHPHGPHCLRCSGPPSLYQRSIITLEESQLDWCTNGAEPSILSDDPKLGLFIGCGFILLILVLVAVGIIIKARRHAAHYYTHEAERPELPPQMQSQSQPHPNGGGDDNGSIGGGRNGGFDNLYYNNGNYKSNKWNKMIATIDEIHFTDVPYPELETIPSIHHNGNGNGGMMREVIDTNGGIMLPPPSSYR